MRNYSVVGLERHSKAANNSKNSSDVIRSVATRHVRNLHTLLNSRSLVAIFTKASFLMFTYNFTYNYCSSFLKKWICIEKYIKYSQIKHHSKSVNGHLRSSGYSVLFRNGSVLFWLSTSELIRKKYVGLT